VKTQILPADDTDAPGAYVMSVQTQVAKGGENQALADIMKVLQGTHDGIGAKTFATQKQAVLAGVAKRDPAELTASVSDLAEEAFQGALVAEGVQVGDAQSPDPTNALRHAIGRANDDQFGRDASALIDFTNLKVMAHGDLADGGRGLVKALQTAGIDTAGISMNPVDMTPYRDQGIPVPGDAVPKRA